MRTHNSQHSSPSSRRDKRTGVGQARRPNILQAVIGVRGVRVGGRVDGVKLTRMGREGWMVVNGLLSMSMSACKPASALPANASAATEGTARAAAIFALWRGGWGGIKYSAVCTVGPRIHSSRVPTGRGEGERCVPKSQGWTAVNCTISQHADTAGGESGDEGGGATRGTQLITRLRLLACAGHVPYRRNNANERHDQAAPVWPASGRHACAPRACARADPRYHGSRVRGAPQALDG